MRTGEEGTGIGGGGGKGTKLTSDVQSNKVGKALATDGANEDLFIEVDDDDDDEDDDEGAESGVNEEDDVEKLRLNVTVGLNSPEADGGEDGGGIWGQSTVRTGTESKLGGIGSFLGAASPSFCNVVGS